MRSPGSSGRAHALLVAHAEAHGVDLSDSLAQRSNGHPDGTTGGGRVG